MLLVTLLVWLQTATTAPALSAQSVEASRLNRDTSAATLRPMGDRGDRNPPDRAGCDLVSRCDQAAGRSPSHRNRQTIPVLLPCWSSSGH